MTPKVIYLNGAIIPAVDASVSVFDRGFLFGDAVYELARTFDGVPIAMNAHIARLKASLDSIQLHSFDAETFRTIADALLEATGLQDADIYIQVSRGASERREHVPSSDLSPTVFAMAMPGPSIGSLQTVTRTAAITSPDQRWRRCDIKATTLLPNILAAMDAHAVGASEAILIRDGFVSEGTHSNVLIVSDGVVVTPPVDDTPSILRGTMRGLATMAATDLGIPVVERAISVAHLKGAEEIALTSSRKILHVVEMLDGVPVQSSEIFSRVFTRMRASIQEVLDNNSNALPAAR